jgi:hypothetical protein
MLMAVHKDLLPMMPHFFGMLALSRITILFLAFLALTRFLIGLLNLAISRFPMSTVYKVFNGSPAI